MDAKQHHIPQHRKERREIRQDPRTRELTLYRSSSLFSSSSPSSSPSSATTPPTILPRIFIQRRRTMRASPQPAATNNARLYNGAHPLHTTCRAPLDLEKIIKISLEENSGAWESGSWAMFEPCWTQKLEDS